MSLISELIGKLLNKPRATASREQALEDMSDAALFAAFICRIGYIIYGLQVVTLIIVVVFFFGYGTIRGQYHLVNEAGAVLYRSLDGTSTIPLIQDGRTWISQALTTVFFFMAFSTALDFFRNVAQSEKPFALARARELKRVGALLVLAALVPDAVAAFMMVVLRSTLFEGMSYGLSYLSELWSLAVGIIVFVFACVFEYGCVLQEQDDALL